MGCQVIGEIFGKYFTRESFVAAKRAKQIIAPMCFQGTCNTLLFDSWVENLLLPQLKPNQIVIMDNASFHKSKKTKELIEQAGCELIFLPPYSPDLNPIEKIWANLKKKIRSHLEKSHSLSDSIDRSFMEMEECKI
jgi:transposase